MREWVFPWLVVKPMIRHTFTTFESILDHGGNRALIWTMISVLIVWHVYTPIHELLHVAACVLGGGTVSELALKPQYGGTLLQPIFPFIVADSDYAGQLTGFTTPNDVVYFLVDMAPYVLSLGGVALIEWARRRKSGFLFSTGLLLAFIPAMSLIGDYYEAASLLTDRLARLFQPDLPARIMISDDVFKSIGQLHTEGHLNGLVAAMVGLGLILAGMLVLWTFVAKWALARRLWSGRGSVAENPFFGGIDPAASDPKQDIV